MYNFKKWVFYLWLYIDNILILIGGILALSYGILLLTNDTFVVSKNLYPFLGRNTIGFINAFLGIILLTAFILIKKNKLKMGGVLATESE